MVGFDRVDQSFEGMDTAALATEAKFLLLRAEDGGSWVDLIHGECAIEKCNLLESIGIGGNAEGGFNHRLLIDNRPL